LRNDGEILLSLDLEDPRLDSEKGCRYPSRVVFNTEKFLSLLEPLSLKCTFFTVGNIMRNHPELIAKVIAAGHELAWHSDSHRPLNEMSREEFRKDLWIAKDFEQQLGVPILGYRAPIFSLTPESNWAHEELGKAGFIYSSSILPAANPLHGWAGYGPEPRITAGVAEIPMRPVKLGPWSVPVGGVYFRLLPRGMLFSAVRHSIASGEAIPTYFHPYDFDPDEEYYMHGGVNRNPLLNLLLYWNRRDALSRLKNLTNQSVRVSTYRDFALKVSQRALSPRPGPLL